MAALNCLVISGLQRPPSNHLLTRSFRSIILIFLCTLSTQKMLHTIFFLMHLAQFVSTVVYLLDLLDLKNTLLLRSNLQFPISLKMKGYICICICICICTGVLCKCTWPLPLPLPLPLPSLLPLSCTSPATVAIVNSPAFSLFFVKKTFIHSFNFFFSYASHTINTNNLFIDILDTQIHSFISRGLATQSTLISSFQHCTAALRNHCCQPFFYHYTHSLHRSVPTITVTRDSHTAPSNLLHTLISSSLSPFHSNFQHPKFVSLRHYVRGSTSPCIYLLQC